MKDLQNQESVGLWSFHYVAWKGKVQLPMLQQPPQILTNLYSMHDENSKYFLKNIRAFNSMFSFTSMAGKVDHKINNGTAPLIFLLGGWNYHSIGSLIPPVNEKPKFAQLYIYDTENEIQNRINVVRSVYMISFTLIKF